MRTPVWAQIRGRRRKRDRNDDRIYTHALHRVEQRYGVKLSPHDLRGIANRIRGGEGTILASQTATRLVVEIEYAGANMVFIYDPTIRVIRTALPRRDCPVDQYLDGITRHFSWVDELKQEKDYEDQRRRD